MISLNKKVALVTGVTRRQGIGAAAALHLARAGADVAAAYYRPYDRSMPWNVQDSEPQEILAELRGAGVCTYGFEIDLEPPDGPRCLFESVLEKFGHVDILVNNAAYSKETTVNELSVRDLDRHYAVNLRAAILLCVEFVRAFQVGRLGRIVNITSGQGLGPMPDDLAYVATKGGIDAFTLSLSAAVAPLGITVNAIDPGPTDTGWMDDDLRDSLLGTAPMHRVGTPADAARLIAFLASEDASWITGQVIRSRGGF
jgi:3-oxoacyl-[acyl-carrier protein] reductase